MRVLVTGGHGFVGSHLVDALLARGDRVRCLVRRGRRPEALEGKDVEVVAGDVRDRAALRAALAGVEEVHHLAGLTRAISRSDMFSVNAGGTERLVRACVATGFGGRFVLCSSQAAAGPSEDGRPPPEGAPPRPRTVYGESKLLAERRLREVGAGLRFTIVRPPAVYGPRDRDFLGVFQAAARGLRTELGIAPRTLTMIYAPDLAEGIVAVARSPRTVGGTYDLSHPEPLTPGDLVDAVVRALGRRTLRVRLPAAFIRLAASASEVAAQLTGRAPLLNRDRLLEMAGPHWVSSTRAATEATGWAARTPLAEGILRTAQWYREHGWIP